MQIKNKEPKISVIMSCYNAESYVKEAINSVLNQTFRDFEFIIIDDGSIDKTLEIIYSFNDKRIKIYSQSNCGLACSLNHGISIAKGKYIARMDADDISMPNRFLIQHQYMEKHDCVDVLGGAMEYINMEGESIGRSFSITSPSLIRFYIRFVDNVIPHPTVFIRKTSLDKYGTYHSPLFAKQDYHLWNKILRKGGTINNLPNILIKYRILSTSVSSCNTFNRKNSKIFSEILSIDQPGIEIIKSLKKSQLYLPQSQRKDPVSKTENILFKKFEAIFGYSNSELIFEFLKNTYLSTKRFAIFKNRIGL